MLLDLNNVYVSACNHGYSVKDYLDDLPLDRVGEVHLAGHVELRDEQGVLLIDSHDCAVSDTVWNLYERFVALRGPVPTLIEWDSDIPSWESLKQEACAARAIQDAAYASDM